MATAIALPGPGAKPADLLADTGTAAATGKLTAARGKQRPARRRGISKRSFSIRCFSTCSRESAATASRRQRRSGVGAQCSPTNTRNRSPKRAASGLPTRSIGRSWLIRRQSHDIACPGQKFDTARTAEDRQSSALRKASDRLEQTVTEETVARSCRTSPRCGGAGRRQNCIRPPLL